MKRDLEGVLEEIGKTGKYNSDVNYVVVGKRASSYKKEFKWTEKRVQEQGIAVD